MDRDDIEFGESPGEFDRLIGLRLTHADAERVEAVLPVTTQLFQAHGIVHGGVYCSAIELVASVGASLRVGLDQRVVGISNRTQFHRAIRSGTLSVQATLASDDSPRQLWEATVTDEGGRLIASGQVHLMRLDPPS
jgi:1,4-dihydroxy-2-naphthoyl-CoA hydrolase